VVVNIHNHWIFYAAGLEVFSCGKKCDLEKVLQTFNKNNNNNKTLV